MFYLDFDFDREVGIGGSKFFGDIAVPAKWLENGVFGEGELFVCQLNLEDFKDCELDFLPKVGTLYFFIDMKTRPFKAVVRFYDEDMDECVTFNEDFECEENVIDDIAICLSEDETYVSAFFEMEDKLCLLKIEYFKEEPILPICGDIYFLIDKSDAKNLDFSKVQLKIVKQL